MRPHYHVVLFGIAPERENYVIRDQARAVFQVERIIKSSWPKGQVHVGRVTEKSLAYCCKHLTKGLKNEIRYEDWMQPEFARMSLRPALGAGAILDFEQWLTSSQGARAIAATGDVPKTFRSNNTQYSFGRYLTGRLRELAGFASASTPECALNAWCGELIKRWDGKSIGTQRAIRLAHGRKANIAKTQQETRL